jgi:hypothetical protein
MVGVRSGPGVIVNWILGIKIQPSNSIVENRHEFEGDLNNIGT